MAKSSVSALHEYCAKNKLMAPVFEYINSDDGFVCRAMIDDVSADGVGRSKRDAKHAATANIIKVLENICPDLAGIPTVEQAALPTTDMYGALRDFCVQNDYPLPTIEIVQQSGTPDAPLFIAKCQVSSVSRFGESEKKKDAKQIAAHAMLAAISHTFVPDLKQQLVGTVDVKAMELEYERREKFRTYREMTGLRENEYVPVKLNDRHNYFTTYRTELKEAALKVLNSKEYELPDAQVVDLFAALKINSKTTKNKAENSVEPFLFIELDCDYDAVFAGFNPDVYYKILDYFRTMLV